MNPQNKDSQNLVDKETWKIAREERLRILANLIIDRIIEDRQNGGLKFQK